VNLYSGVESDRVCKVIDELLALDRNMERFLMNLGLCYHKLGCAWVCCI
jgi:hypothetical protein